jgi:hypothetical protein
MTLRFHRRISLLKGLRINLSKSGASVSVGHRGAWITLGPKGRRMTVGLPGTGIYWTETNKRPLVALVPRGQFLAVWGWPLVILAIVAIAWWLG